MLQERSTVKEIDNKTIAQLRNKRDGNTINTRLRALWALHATGNLKEKEVRSLVKDKDEHMRIWAMKIMVDNGKASKEASKAIIGHAHSEKSPLVRLHLASIMRNLAEQDRWKLAEILSASEDLKGDPVFPLMIWYGIEELIKSSAKKSLQLAKSSKLRTLTEWIPRRLAE